MTTTDLRAYLAVLSEVVPWRKGPVGRVVAWVLGPGLAALGPMAAFDALVIAALLAIARHPATLGLRDTLLGIALYSYDEALKPWAQALYGLAVLLAVESLTLACRLMARVERRRSPFRPWLVASVR